MTAPRIDQVRKRANRAIHRIAEALEHVEDLHTLGWYRHADYRARERITGGDPTAVGIDLDNNGNPDARDAYEQLGDDLIAIETRVEKAVAHAMATFDVGLIRARRDQTADATTPEVITALGRRDKRKREGEYTPTAVIDQPLPTGAGPYLTTAATLDELEHLRNAVRKTGQKADRRRFTPREQDAWNTALGTTKSRRKKARKGP